MNRGKKKCELLKTIRCQVAKKNGIEYTYTECTYQGECRGTCPKCEEELRYLTRELEKLKQSGKQVAVAGVAAAVIATAGAGCSPNLSDNQNPLIQEEQLAGDVAYIPPEETEEVEVEIAGMMLPPEEETVEVVTMGSLAEAPEEPEVYVTAGEPLPSLPSIDDAIFDLQQSGELYMGSFERTTIQVEWEAYLTESGENFDVFAVDGQQIIVTYYEDGWGDSATLYEAPAAEGESE